MWAFEMKTSVFALFADRSSGKVLLVRDHRSRWTLPGGKVNRGEREVDALRREVMEEIGVRLPINLGLSVSRRIDRPWRRRAAALFQLSVKSNLEVSPSAEIREAAWFDRAALPADLGRTAALLLGAQVYATVAA
jgi:ADP-ribose pyrophosphatase YjhB (NUDIX family)